MKCPNCGRDVRSKTQCAYCGHSFKAGEASTPASTRSASSERGEETRVQESQPEQFREASELRATRETQEAPAVVPRTKRKGGNVIWNILKLLIAVAIVFLLFLFGPNLVGQVMDYFNSDDNILVQTLGSNEEEEEPAENNEADSDAENVDSEGDESSSGEEGTSTEEESASSLTLVEQNVNLDNYPKIDVTLDFEETLTDVDQTTFDFIVESANNGETELSEYSLYKENQRLVLSFNDPNLAVVAVDEQEQTLRLASEALGFEESITYALPNVTVDQAQAEQFNATINEQLANGVNVSAVFYEVGADVPFVYDGQTIEANSAISWFVLQRIFEGVAEGELELNHPVEINDALKAAEDVGTVAELEAATTMTVEELALLTVQERDLSAMNHLIQETGGLNEFNLWLNESGYFATRMNAPLGYDDNAQTTGAVTNSQDIGNLLGKLAQNELIDESNDELFKEMLLQSPMSEKYPTGLEQVTTRYEMLSADENPNNQYYTGILETEETAYVVIFFISNFDNADAIVSSIASSIQELVTYFETGSVEAEEEEEESEEVIEEPAVSEEVVETPQVEFTDETPQETPAQNVSPSGEPTDDIYEGKPTENFYNFSDGYRQGIWHQTEEGAWIYH